ncbi:endonuclease/exonuclease/phosphatase family protein [Flavobacteriaceae bacterium M23B6Z8]
MQLRVFLLFLITGIQLSQPQSSSFAIRTVAFYNVENLFDTINDPLTYDDSRTPEGKDNWNGKRYTLKIDHLAKVISQIGSDKTSHPPDILGIAEIENMHVLKDLVSHKLLAPYAYHIVHKDSPDRRGIDVAFLFKSDVFIPIDFKNYRLLLKDEYANTVYTRDQLLISGLLDGEQFYFIVNHWPSRRGGEHESRYKRIKAASLNKRIIDSIQRIDPLARIISMGDFNDDPTDPSFKRILKTKTENEADGAYALINPMESLFQKGMGSLAYGDSWNLFDQFYFTSSLLKENTIESYYHWKTQIFNPPFLTLSEGKYKGYPFRTYAGGTYTGGYSDHFPVYLYLIKPIKNN